MRKSWKCLLKSEYVFLAVLLVVGILTTFSYGVYWDQKSEQDILLSNIKEYALHLDFANCSWIQNLTEMEVPAISESVEKDHGIAPYYPAAVVGLINNVSPYAGNVFWHMYTFLLVFAGIVSLYFLCKDLFDGKKIAGIVTLLFYLTPRMFASGHYNNKDMVFLSLVCMLFYWGRRLIKEHTWKSVIIFAVIGAFAFNVKIIAVFFFGLIGFYALLRFIFTKEFDRSILIKCIACIALWFAVFVLITPASWSGIGSYFEYVLGFTLDFNRWSNYILFNGKMIHSVLDGIPNSYLPRMIIYTTPLAVLGLTVIGGIGVIWDWIKGGFRKIWDTQGYVMLILIMGFVPTAYAVAASPIIYNGWRHFYFVYASIIIGAGYGVYKIDSLFKGKIADRIKQGCFIAYMVVSAILLAVNYPLADCYYNCLAGEEIQSKFEMDYWNVSMKQVYEKILEDAAGEEIVSVSGINSYTRFGLECNRAVLSREQTQKIVLYPESNWKEADYVVVNITYAIMYSPADYAWVQENYERVETLKSYGNAVTEIYKR